MYIIVNNLVYYHYIILNIFIDLICIHLYYIYTVCVIFYKYWQFSKYKIIINI